METQHSAPQSPQIPDPVNAEPIAPSLGPLPVTPDAGNPEAQASYVKLAMRNMVRKRGTSLKHFFLTFAGLLGLLIGLSYLTR